MEKKRLKGVNLRVIFYEEEGFRVAHCLEMDLKGKGKTNDEALNVLKDLVAVQIKSAFEKEDPGLLKNPADKKRFDAYHKLQREFLASSPESYTLDNLSFCQIVMPLPEKPDS